MVFKNCDKVVPTNIGPCTQEDEALLTKTRYLQQMAAEAIAHQSIQKYIAAMVSMIWDANKYIDDMEPWVLRKTDTEQMKTVFFQ